MQRLKEKNKIFESNTIQATQTTQSINSDDFLIPLLVKLDNKTNGKLRIISKSMKERFDTFQLNTSVINFIDGLNSSLLLNLLKNLLRSKKISLIELSNPKDHHNLLLNRIVSLESIPTTPKQFLNARTRITENVILLTDTYILYKMFKHKVLDEVTIFFKDTKINLTTKQHELMEKPTTYRKYGIESKEVYHSLINLIDDMNKCKIEQDPERIDRITFKYNRDQALFSTWVKLAVFYLLLSEYAIFQLPLDVAFILSVFNIILTVGMTLIAKTDNFSRPTLWGMDNPPANYLDYPILYLHDEHKKSLEMLISSLPEGNALQLFIKQNQIKPIRLLLNELKKIAAKPSRNFNFIEQERVRLSLKLETAIQDIGKLETTISENNVYTIFKQKETVSRRVEKFNHKFSLWIKNYDLMRENPEYQLTEDFIKKLR